MFPYKMVAILNEKLEPGVAMNALAHMCIGLGAHLGKEPLRLTEYTDKSGGKHPHISEMPFMVLKANATKIKALKAIALAAGIEVVDFLQTMTLGTSQEQLAHTKELTEDQLVYYGLVLFGEWDKVSELTRQFSLWH